MNTIMDIEDVKGFGNHLKKTIQSYYDDLHVTRGFDERNSFYLSGIKIKLEDLPLEKTIISIYFNIAKYQQNCAMGINFSRYDQNDWLLNTDKSRFEEIWDTYKEILFEIYKTMLNEFEIFIKKYPVLRINYLMNPGKLLLIKPQKIEDLKNHINV